MSPQPTKDQIRKHDYDGIQEYDNQLPRWWLITFWLTVLFGFGYWLYDQTFQIGPSSEAALETSLQAIQSKTSAIGEEEVTDEEILLLSQNPQTMIEAKEIFSKNCVACHGAQAQGIIGPNLTDAYWLHGNRPFQIFHVIENGVPEKGMVPWKGILTHEQMKKMVAFVLFVQGSNPPNPKPPQGDELRRTKGL